MDCKALERLEVELEMSDESEWYIEYIGVVVGWLLLWDVD